MYFICQNLEHIHMTCSFLELFVFFWLTLVDIWCLEFISHHTEEIVCEYELHGKPIMKWKQTFSLVSDIDVEKTCFFNAKVKFLMNDF